MRRMFDTCAARATGGSETRGSMTKRYTTLLLGLIAATLVPVTPSIAADDLEDPVITVDLERGAVITSPVELTGTASDNVGVSKVRVSIKNGATNLWLHPDGSWLPAEFRYFSDLTPQGPNAVTWSFSASLPDGSYFANIRAADFNSNHDAVKPFFAFDVAGQDAPPLVTTNLSPGTTFESTVAFGGTVEDDVGVASVKVGIRDRDSGLWLRKDGTFQAGLRRQRAELSNNGGSGLIWNHTVSIPDGSYAASVVATDTAGQQTPIRPWVKFTVGAEPEPVRLVAAGDVAKCGNNGHLETAALLDRIFAEQDGTLALLGDGAYQDGKLSEYNNCYAPHWGRHRFRTKPSPGNHDYHTDGAAGYFAYFGARAGDPDKGYYAYDLGTWRAIALNTECGEIGGCGTNSPQYQWLQNELANNPSQCIVAYGHRPRFDSGPHDNNPSLRHLWRLLYGANADVVLAGHSHNYQRYDKMNASGNPVADGIRSFIVGTGGTNLRDLESPHPELRVFRENNHGVIVLELGEDSYDWTFVNVDDEVLDSGSSGC